MHADKSTICANVDLEGEAKVEHLVPKHATQLTFVKDRSISVNVDDKIPPQEDECDSDPEDDSFEIEEAEEDNIILQACIISKYPEGQCGLVVPWISKVL